MDSPLKEGGYILYKIKNVIIFCTNTIEKKLKKMYTLERQMYYTDKSEIFLYKKEVEKKKRKVQKNCKHFLKKGKMVLQKGYIQACNKRKQCL